MHYPSVPQQDISTTKDNGINERLMNSYAGRIGRGLTYISRYIGFDYRINIALLSGVAGKELVLSTLSSAYSLSKDNKDISSLLKVIQGGSLGNDTPQGFFPACLYNALCTMLPYTHNDMEGGRTEMGRVLICVLNSPCLCGLFCDLSGRGDSFLPIT